MKNTDRFKSKVVLITGGTSGIGLATAVQFALQGAAHVIVCGRTASKWDAAQPYIAHLPKNTIEYLPCDVRVESQVQDLIAQIIHRYKRLDICFNNAGVQPLDSAVGGDITKMNFPSSLEPDGSIIFRIPAHPNPSDPAAFTPVSAYWESPLATSIFGIFYCMKWQFHYAFDTHPKNLPFSIISTSSRNGVIPDPHRPLYAGAKAFILSLTRSLASQAAQRCVKEKRAMIRVNAISPGPVDTPLERAAFPGSDAEFIAAASTGVPMQRVATSEEIAPSVLFLADESCSGYITGANLPIDGGHVASPMLRQNKCGES